MSLFFKSLSWKLSLNTFCSLKRYEKDYFGSKLLGKSMMTTIPPPITYSDSKQQTGARAVMPGPWHLAPAPPVARSSAGDTEDKHEARSDRDAAPRGRRLPPPATTIWVGYSPCNKPRPIQMSNLNVSVDPVLSCARFCGSLLELK